jgi:type II secretory ATPase GspE/PulE/Tfp pilus assembly ATPase PilB-like protein
MEFEFSRIGMNQATQKRFLAHCARPDGLVLVAGPKKSGRTTTIYGALTALGLEERKVVSIETRGGEDVPGLLRMRTPAHDVERFDGFLEAALQSDIDALVLDIDDDMQAASAALLAASKDILVIASIEANSAAEGLFNFAYLTDSLPEVTRLLHCVLGQRLVRTICPKCKRDYLPSDYELGAVDCPPKEALSKTFHRGEGCEACGKTGYAGRTGLFALLELDDEIRLQILKRRVSPEEIHTLAVQKGMVSQIDDGWKKICEGVTTIEEIARLQSQDYRKLESNARAQVSGEDVDPFRFNGDPLLKSLIEQGVVEREDFDAGKYRRTERKERKEEDYMDAVAHGYSIGRVDLVNWKVTPELLAQMPANVCRKFEVFPVLFAEGAVWVAWGDPASRPMEDLLEELSEILGKKVLCCLASKTQIYQVIQKYYGPEASSVGSGLREFEKGAQRFVNTALGRCAGAEDVTDLHFERHADGLKVRVRIAGELYSAAPAQPELADAVIQRLKIMASMKADVSNIPQQGRLKLNLLDGKSLNMFATLLPTVHGESIHFRVEEKKRE